MSEQALSLQQILPYIFQDISFLDRALVAGDTESDDREGHRGLSQVGDALMKFVLLCEGFSHGLTRKSQQESLSALSSRDECAKLARRLGIDKLVRCSRRQHHIVPQPATLKNTLGAIVAAAYYDSGTIDSAFQVMASLGIVNRAQHCVSPQDLRLENSPAENLSLDGMEFDDSSRAGQQVSLEDWEVLFPSIQLQRKDIRPIDSRSVPLTTLSKTTSDGQQAHILREIGVNGNAAILSPQTNRMVAHCAIEDLPSTSNDAQTSVPEHSHRINHHEQAMKRPRGAGSQVSSREDGVSELSISLRQRVRKTPRSIEADNKRNSRGEAVMCDINSRCIKHVEDEVDRGANREELSRHVSEYSASICLTAAARPEILVKTALGIGGCAAMLTLQQAIESVRIEAADDAVLVSRPRSVGERLAAIRHLDLRMAQFRIARRLHIYHLYLEAQAEVARVESDGFIFVNPTSSESLPGHKKHGNPRNGVKARVTDIMVGQGGVRLTGRKELARQRGFITSLRRFGQRLKLLKDKFSIGILAILPDDMDENIVRSSDDRAFNEFVCVIDRFDGDKIRALSSAACLITQFLNDGNNRDVVFKIETATAEYINGLECGSPGMEELLRPI